MTARESNTTDKRDAPAPRRECRRSCAMNARAGHQPVSEERATISRAHFHLTRLIARTLVNSRTSAFAAPLIVLVHLHDSLSRPILFFFGHLLADFVESVEGGRLRKRNSSV